MPWLGGWNHAPIPFFISLGSCHISPGIDYSTPTNNSAPVSPSHGNILEMPSKTLFTVPVPSTDGSFTCSTVADRIYLLAFASPPDNRLTSAFIDAFLLSLDIIEEKYPKGVVITTSSIPKFYSNGLDIEHVLDTPNFFAEKMNKLCDRLLT